MQIRNPLIHHKNCNHNNIRVYSTIVCNVAKNGYEFALTSPYNHQYELKRLANSSTRSSHQAQQYGINNTRSALQIFIYIVSKILHYIGYHHQSMRNQSSKSKSNFVKSSNMIIGCHSLNTRYISFNPKL